MSRLVSITWVIGGMVMSAACGSHAPPRAAPDGGALARDSLEVYIGKVRRLSIAVAPKRPATMTVETQNEELRSALALLRTFPTAGRHWRVANAYRSAGILDLAYDHLVAARDLDNRDAAAYDGLARIWRDWGVPHLGIGDARRAVYYAPRSAAVHNTLGTLLDAVGQRAEARREFERAIALDPGATFAWTNLCYQSFQAGELDAAMVSCRRALALDPAFAPAHNNLALVFAATGNAPLAAAELAAAGDEAAREYNVGIVFSARRQYADAARAFDRAGRLRPGWSIAAERARQAHRLARAPGNQ